MTTQTLLPIGPDRAAVTLATVALGLFGYFSLILIALHFIRPDYTPVDQTICKLMECRVCRLIEFPGNLRTRNDR